MDSSASFPHDHEALLPIITRVRASLDIPTIVQQVVTEGRNFLQADRVILYRLDKDLIGTVVAESVGEGWWCCLGEVDTCLSATWSVEALKYNCISTPDIHAGNFTPGQLDLLVQYQVRARLVIPILRYGKIWGALVAHQCDGPRDWEERNITFLHQIAEQFTLALTQAEQVLRQQEQAQIEREQMLDLVSRMRSSLDLATIFQITVEAVHTFLQSDRVVLYKFNESFIGTVIAESISPGWRVSLGETILDTCFQTTRASQYTKDKIHATSDIYKAGFTPCYLDLLSLFQVQANLVVPIFKEDQVWGLLIAHQCSAPRVWDQTAINFCYHAVTQLTISLLQDDAIHKLQLQKEEQWGAKAREQFFLLLNKLPQFSCLKEILTTLVTEVRRLLQADRVVVYQFNSDWSGSFISESLGAGWIPLLQLQERNPLLKDNISACNIQMFEQCDTPTRDQKSKLRVTNNIYEAGFSDCYLKILELYQARAYIIVPVLLDDKCWGLLAVYQNDGPRQWRESEINLIYQIATQLTIAIQRHQIHLATQTQIQELERLAQLKDDFLSTVSHELRSPLNNMSVALAMLKRNPSDERRAFYIQSLATECKREVELINDLLDLQRLEEGSQPVALEKIWLQEWLTQLMEPFLVRASSRDQILQLHLDLELDHLCSSPPALARIITELLNNACKYTPAGGTIALQGYRAEQTVKFIVTNNGPVIAPEVIPLIFEKFYRIPSPDPWKQSGTGLGLALVKRLVQELGGTIEVTSREGETCFAVALPLGR